MTFQSNIFLLLGAFCICVVTATVDPNIPMKKPYGFRTCQRLCIRITECSCYLYLSYGTTCPTRIAAENQQKSEMDRRKMQVEKILNCSQSRGTLQSIKQCRPSLERLLPFNMKEERREGEITKLLILPYPRSQQGLQLFLHNNTVVPYPFIRVSRVIAVAYISSLRKLVISTLIPQQLFFTPLYELKIYIVKKSIRVLGFAVDDKKHLVFMTTRSPSRGYSVSVMTTEGKNWTSLVILKCSPWGIAADHTRSLIYVVCYRENISMFTYQGVPRGAIPGQRVVGAALSMDLESNSLYFTQQTSHTMFKVALSDHSVFNLTTFETNVKNIFVIYNTIYVSLNGKNYILAINVNDSSKVTNIGMHCRTAPTAAIMCAIP